MSDEGLQRSAILLMSIGEEHAADVLKFLAPREVQKLGQTMANLKSVSRQDMEKTLSSFRTEADQRTTLGLGSDEYVRNVLIKALGDDKAAGLIERMLHAGDTSGIDGLKWMDSPSVAELIKGEHPQIIATILVHLDRDQASEVLGCFTERLRNDVLLRIATLAGVQPSALR
jgi:flagellar motor switch protein FliG